VPAGCGGGGSPAAGSSHYQEALAYAQCMRSHGTANFPDPNSNGTVVVGNGADQNSPQCLAADKGCEKLLPNGGQMTPQQLAQAMKASLKYSACGVKDFPDLTEGTGGITFSNAGPAGPDQPASSSGKPQTTAGGLDASSPQYQAANQACRYGLLGGSS
jgi:hypothetical protein